MLKYLFRLTAICLGLTFCPFISNATPVPGYGTWINYFPLNKTYTLQFNQLGTFTGQQAVKQVADPLLRYDIYNGTYGNLCGSGVVEEFKVKTCTMTNKDTGVVSQAQFVVLLGRNGHNA